MSLGIRANLFAGFGVVLALNLVIGYIGLRNTAELSSQFKTLYEDRMMSIVKLTAVTSAIAPTSRRFSVAQPTHPLSDTAVSVP